MDAFDRFFEMVFELVFGLAMELGTVPYCSAVAGSAKKAGVPLRAAEAADDAYWQTAGSDGTVRGVPKVAITCGRRRSPRGTEADPSGLLPS